MSDERQWHLDLVACLLLVVGLALCLAVLGRDPTSPTATYPATGAEDSRHPLGASGAAVGRCLTEALGLAVYVLLSAWFVLVVLVFLRQRWLTWGRRLAGWLLLIPTTAV